MTTRAFLTLGDLREQTRDLSDDTEILILFDGEYGTCGLTSLRYEPTHSEPHVSVLKIVGY